MLIKAVQVCLGKKERQTHGERTEIGQGRQTIKAERESTAEIVSGVGSVGWLVAMAQGGSTQGLLKCSSFGTKSLDEFCRNCARDVNVNLEVYRTELGVFCGRNCYWSLVLDASNNRSKKSRKLPPVTRRESRVGAGGQMVLSEEAVLPLAPLESMAEYSHAIFQYQALLNVNSVAPSRPLKY